MSINSCTIDCNTIDALCNDRRQQIIDTLIPPTATSFFGGHHPQHVRADTKLPLSMFHRRDVDREEVFTETLELPQITVTISMAGENFAQTLDRGDEHFRPMINVYGLSMKEAEEPVKIHVYGLSVREVVEESVNITDIKIRIL